MLKHLLFVALLFTSPLAAEKTVLAFAGSTRDNSYNKYLANEAAEIARQLGAKVRVIDLKDYPLPLYDGDVEEKNGMPDKAKELRRMMIESDAIIIASPEYNASLTGVLKNTLDWASRTENKQGSNEAFKGKKFAIMSASPGQGGGKRGILHLQAIIQALGGQVVEVQVLVPQANLAFNAQGQLTNNAVKQELQKEIQLLVK